MTEAGVRTPVQGPSPGLWARCVGVILRPRDTFVQVVAAPRWVGVLALVVFVTAASNTWLLSTDVGQQALLQQQVDAMESFGVQVTDEMYEQLAQRVEMGMYFTAGGVVAGIPLMTLIVAGAVFSIFYAVLGGDASFKQVFAIVTHVEAVGLLQQLFVTPLNYARGSIGSPSTLAAFFPMLTEGSFLRFLLSAIDLFIVWRLVLLAMGLAVLYRRRTQAIAATFFALYGVIAVAIAGVRIVLGGS